MEKMLQSDHDLLIAINIGQLDMRADVRLMSDLLTEFKKSLELTNQRQNDLETRTTNLSNTVQRLFADYNDSNRIINTLRDDMGKWKLYIKMLVILSTPIYLII